MIHYPASESINKLLSLSARSCDIGMYGFVVLGLLSFLFQSFPEFFADMFTSFIQTKPFYRSTHDDVETFHGTFEQVFKICNHRFEHF